MGLIDKLNEFCDATSLNTGTTAAAVVGNVIDLGNTSNFPGNSDIWCVIKVQTSVTSDGSATVQFKLNSSTLVALTGGTTTTHFDSGALAKTTLVAGYTVAAFKLPRGTYQRYLGIFQTNATAELTAGKIDAYLTIDPPSDPTISFPDALTK